MEKMGSLALVLVIGCGGSAYEYSASGGMEESTSYGDDGMAAAAPPTEPAVTAAEADYGGGDAEMESWDSWGGDDSAGASRSETPAAQRPQLAQNQPTQPTGGGQTGQQRPAEQTDAIDPSQPLLIYTAQIHLGVYEVEATQETIIGAVNEVRGFLAQRTDTMLVVRVPAATFQQVLDKIEEAGDVLHRQVEALDVSEEFRDIAIRIRNAEAMRDRLEQLLRQASNVEEALAVERELQRLTESIEQMKGRQRWLADRIAFSTITVHFQARTTEQINTDPFRLPFEWLDTLGLRNLLSL